MTVCLAFKVVRSLVIGLFLVPKDLAWAQGAHVVSQRAPASLSEARPRADITKSEVYQQALTIIRALNMTDLINVLVGTLRGVEQALEKAGWQRCPADRLLDSKGQFLFFVRELRCFNPGSENPGHWVVKFYTASQSEQAVFFASIEQTRRRLESADL